MAGTSPSNAVATGSIPGQGSRIPQASQANKTKHNTTWNRRNIVTDSTGTLKWSTSKKTLKENLGKGKNSVSFLGLSCYHPQCFPLRVSVACTKGMVTVNCRKS